MKKIFNVRRGFITAGLTSLAVLAGASSAAAQTAPSPPGCAKNVKVDYNDPILEINTPYRNKKSEDVVFFYIGRARLENIRDRYISDFATACGRLYDDKKDDPALLSRAQSDFIVYMLKKINFPGTPEELEKKASQIRGELLDNIPFSANAPAAFRGNKAEGAEKTGCLLTEPDLRLSAQQYFQYAIAGGPIDGFNNARGSDTDYPGFYTLRQVVKCLKPELDEMNVTKFAAMSMVASLPDKRPLIEALRDAAVLNTWAALPKNGYEGEGFDNIYAFDAALAGTKVPPARIMPDPEVAESIRRKLRTVRFGFDTLRDTQQFKLAIGHMIQAASPSELPSMVQLQNAYLAGTATPPRPAMTSSANARPSSP